ncbi:MAG: exonuclease SbcCD subunit D C-terminal domain-containing protein, partial [Lachnospiraceae bacterium]|nr:exonuclease SbcCD subunit D C-terminal domain-containing protein [Lachnospiraceae bacterium]
DSAERLSFGASLLAKSGLYIAGGEEVREVILEDSFGKVAFHLLPFVKPAVVGASDCQEAVMKQMQQMQENWTAADRHVLVTHFFVCAGGKEPELSDSEQHSYVGGLEQVDVSLFEAYDYVALGHIHKPQCMRRGKVFYAGSPLCYSFSECTASEAFSRKGVFIVELEESGAMSVVRKPLHPRRNMRILKGSLQELIQQDSSVNCEDYIQAILTDKEELFDPIGSLRSVYPNTMQIVLEKRLREGSTPMLRGEQSKSKNMEELFGSFYEALAGEPMDEARAEVVREITLEVEDAKE